MARPARYGERADHTIRVRVTSAQLRDIQRAAEENDLDVAGLVREAVNEFVSDYRESKVFRGSKLTAPVHHST